jgi:hypothetical protein
VTPLGASYTFDSDSTGYIHSISDADASSAYAFNKSPVTMINERIYGGSHVSSYIQYTMEINGHKVGYHFDSGGNLPGATYAPTFAAITGSWSSSAPNPPADINSTGQSISSLTQMLNNTTLQRFAAFTTVGGGTHQGQRALIGSSGDL